jgi:hypothetical protein
VDTKAFTFSTKEISKFQEMANKYEQDNNKQPREKLSFDASKKVDFGDSSKETKDKENREMIQNFLDAYNGLEKQDKEQLNRNYPQLQLLIEDLTKILHPYIMKTKEQQRAEKTTETV